MEAEMKGEEERVNKLLAKLRDQILDFADSNDISPLFSGLFLANLGTALYVATCGFDETPMKFFRQAIQAGIDKGLEKYRELSADQTLN